jgi:arsenate reductase
MPSEKTTLMFLCTGNACRSQMAEGLTRELKGDLFDVYSAGIEAHGLNPRAVEVMKELGIDISDQYSKTVDELPEITFDYVVTVCDSARESCPLFTETTHLVHAGFDDPAAAEGTEEEIMAVFRRVRDEIRDFVENLPESLETAGEQDQ